MSSRRISLFVAGVLVVGWLIADRLPVRAGDDAPDADRIAALETQVETLQSELAALRATVEALQKRHAQQLVYEFTPEADLVPRESVPEETLGGKYRPHGRINGLPYYVIPLNRESETSPPVPAPSR